MFNYDGLRRIMTVAMELSIAVSGVFSDLC
jgi:hypothetical protein